MFDSKIVAFALIILLASTISITLYQYSQNLDLNSQKIDATTQLEITANRLEMSTILSMVQTEINSQLERIDKSMLAACTKLSTMDLMGEQARAVMTDLAENNPFIVNAATADRDDTLLVVAPGEYRSIEAINMCYQEQNIKMHAELRPVMSSMILLVEGFYGVVMVAPIFDVNSAFIGSLSIVIQPAEIIEAVIAPALEGTPYSIWAMQTNGTLLYDPDPAQQGKNLLTDPIYADYPEVQAFARQVAEQQSGYGTYQYYVKNLDQTQNEVVSKEAYWMTVGIYGTEWRLVIWNAL